MLLSEQRGLEPDNLTAMRDWGVRIIKAREADGVRASRTLSEYFRNPVDDNECEFFAFAMKVFWSSPLPNAFRRAFGREPMLLLDLCKFRGQSAAAPQNYVRGTWMPTSMASTCRS